MRIYSIYDTKAEQFGNPVCIRTDAEARRMFKALATDGETQVGRNPEDFLLYRIGVFDAEKGTVTGEPGVAIAMAIEFKETN